MSRLFSLLSCLWWIVVEYLTLNHLSSNITNVSCRWLVFVLVKCLVVSPSSFLVCGWSQFWVTFRYTNWFFCINKCLSLKSVLSSIICQENIYFHHCLSSMVRLRYPSLVDRLRHRYSSLFLFSDYLVSLNKKDKLKGGKISWRAFLLLIAFFLCRGLVADASFLERLFFLEPPLDACFVKNLESILNIYTSHRVFLLDESSWGRFTPVSSEVSSSKFDFLKPFAASQCRKILMVSLLLSIQLVDHSRDDLSVSSQ